MSQTDAILADLMAGKAITPKDALRDHRCMRLAAIIHVLRQDGFRIQAEMISAKRRGGESYSYAKYTMQQRRRARSLIAQRARDRAGIVKVTSKRTAQARRSRKAKAAPKRTRRTSGKGRAA